MNTRFLDELKGPKLTILAMMRHYTYGAGFTKLRKVIARWEVFKNISEWGWYWTGGYLVEFIDGTRAHIHGWNESDAPWVDEAWVYCNYLDIDSPEYAQLLLDHKWEIYALEVSR